MNNIRIGLEIQAINNGFLVTGHKTDGLRGADTGPTFFNDFKELAAALEQQVRQSFDLEFEEPEYMDGWGGTKQVSLGGLN